jgi:hypothetical protein
MIFHAVCFAHSVLIYVSPKSSPPWLVARSKCKGKHEIEFGRRGVMECAEKGRRTFRALFDLRLFAAEFSQ